MADTAGAGRLGPVVAIIGGGASGTLTAVNLLRSAAARRLPMRIMLIDAHGRHGVGLAYSTRHQEHLLNVPAGQMSALADDPGHLVRWAERQCDPGPEAGERGLAGAFLPRRDFGRYLRDTLEQAERRAQPFGRLIRVSGQVQAIRQPARGPALRLVVAGGGLAGGSMDADYAVLATGSLPSALPFPAPGSPRVIVDPWAPGALERAADGQPVVIAGSGLTMLDIAVAVTGGGSQAAVHAISRHGLTPRVHRGLRTGPVPPLWLPVLGDKVSPIALPELMWQVRAAMRSRPDGWQDVIDGLRPYLPGLWQRLPADDQRAFLHHYSRFWEVHRHRVAPAMASRITSLGCSRQLTIEAGRITGAEEAPGGLRVTVAAAGRTREIAAGWLINATGPVSDVTATADPLLNDLLGSGLAQPDQVRLGLAAAADGALLSAAGQPSAALYAIGPVLRGTRYETTAIREIREQAADLASLLSGAQAARAHRGTAA